MDDDERQRIALWRLGVLGPLMSARLDHGDVSAYVRQAAERLHRMPDGHEVRLSASTIEAWHYAYQHHGLAALMPKDRSDKGMTRAIRPTVADLLLRAKAEKPRRSIRRLIKMMFTKSLGRHRSSRTPGLPTVQPYPGGYRSSRRGVPRRPAVDRTLGEAAR
jgi:hypothetical protein